MAYSKFVEIAPGRREFFIELFNYFSGKKEYWQIWLAIIEIICLSQERFAFLPREEFIDFYKKISITKEWGNVLKELNLKINKGLKKTIEREVFQNIFKNGI